MLTSRCPLIGFTRESEKFFAAEDKPACDPLFFETPQPIAQGCTGGPSSCY